ncbi:hypothetical protein SKAU_G00049690 [Synaphobranchus kaupii]|uniref:Uncharacterized protein n=1 Tax=Synaphobranchus kaupii TaxID=118154 RepID=A0A9Q1G2T0_SYNKA|nr:hypothetical protein SKAU_G00049690 [Synaphobranchus kaupii]
MDRPALEYNTSAEESGRNRTKVKGVVLASPSQFNPVTLSVSQTAIGACSPPPPSFNSSSEAKAERLSCERLGSQRPSDARKNRHRPRSFHSLHFLE